MSAISGDFGSILQQLKSFENTLSSSSASGNTAIGSFLSALEGVLQTGENLLAANSAGAATQASSSQAVTSNSASPLPPVGATNTATPTLIQNSSTAAASSDPGTAHLLPAGSSPDKNKPDIAQFTALTGADFATAAELLYGVIGSNTDLRDWSAIMASSNPIADAKASTAALYNSSLNYASSDATAPSGSDLLGKAGNFEYSLEQLDPVPAPKTPMLFVSDGQGNRLRAISDPASLKEAATEFGFDTSALTTLQNQLDTAGVQFRTGAWTNGFVLSAA